MKFELIEVSGLEAAMHGMRNPKNSWARSDSSRISYDPNYKGYYIGPNDMKLAQGLIAAGSEHRKFLRYIHASFNMTAPLYIWKEFDTYKIGTVANSTSTMHKIMESEFTPDMFEIEGLRGYKKRLNRKLFMTQMKKFGNLIHIIAYMKYQILVE